LVCGSWILAREYTSASPWTSSEVATLSTDCHSFLIAWLCNKIEGCSTCAGTFVVDSRVRLTLPDDVASGDIVLRRSRFRWRRLSCLRRWAWSKSLQINSWSALDNWLRIKAYLKFRQGLKSMNGIHTFGWNFCYTGSIGKRTVHLGMCFRVRTFTDLTAEQTHGLDDDGLGVPLSSRTCCNWGDRSELGCLLTRSFLSDQLAWFRLLYEGVERIS